MFHLLFCNFAEKLNYSVVRNSNHTKQKFHLIEWAHCCNHLNVLDVKKVGRTFFPSCIRSNQMRNVIQRLILSDAQSTNLHTTSSFSLSLSHTHTHSHSLAYFSFSFVSFTHTHKHTHIHTHTHALTHTCTYTHMHIHTCTHTYTLTYTHTYTLKHTFTHTHTHIHTLKHTFTHTQHFYSHSQSKRFHRHKPSPSLLHQANKQT